MHEILFINIFFSSEKLNISIHLHNPSNQLQIIISLSRLYLAKLLAYIYYQNYI